MLEYVVVAQIEWAPAGIDIRIKVEIWKALSKPEYRMGPNRQTLLINEISSLLVDVEKHSHSLHSARCMNTFPSFIQMTNNS